MAINEEFKKWQKTLFERISHLEFISCYLTKYPRRWILLIRQTMKDVKKWELSVNYSKK